MLVCFVVVIYLQVYVCVCVHVCCTVLIVFSYALVSYVHIKTFYFLHVGQHYVLV